jgi:hypothetical protein
LRLNRVDVIHQRRRRYAAAQVDGPGDGQNGQINAPALACKEVSSVADDAA